MWNISYEKPTRKNFNDLTGKVFGRLRVVSFDYIKRRYRLSLPYWNCLCECGNEVSVDSTHLVRGSTISCGCYHKEKSVLLLTKHGLSKHPVYHRAVNEIRRCHNQNDASFHNYGGRGITVYEPWLDDLGLMTRDILRLIGLPPTQKHQLDRDDNDKGYQPTNICWKTPEENGRNKRTTHNHAIDPITRKPTPTYRAWARLLYNYGDEVCIEWRSDGNPDTDNGFKNFFKDMGEKPYYGKYKHSPLKRHDESKPFCKENCYWG